jgi:hypothetical protein
LIDEKILIDVKQPLPDNRIGILPQRVLRPGEIGVAKKITIVFPPDDLIQDPGLATTKDIFTPDFDYI